jgi:hypothetical protein
MRPGNGIANMGLEHRNMAFAMNGFLIATRDYEYHFHTIDNALFMFVVLAGKIANNIYRPIEEKCQDWHMNRLSLLYLRLRERCSRIICASKDIFEQDNNIVHRMIL